MDLTPLPDGGQGGISTALGVKDLGEPEGEPGMARKKELAKKEIYRLWWEYLHRSRRFNDFRKWIEKNKKIDLFRFWDTVPQKFTITITSKGRQFINLTYSFPRYFFLTY